MKNSRASRRAAGAERRPDRRLPLAAQAPAPAAGWPRSRTQSAAAPRPRASAGLQRRTDRPPATASIIGVTGDAHLGGWRRDTARSSAAAIVRHLALRLLGLDAVAQARDHAEARMVRAIELHRRSAASGGAETRRPRLERRTPGGSTPTTVTGSSSMRTAWPTIAGSPPNRRCHASSVMIATERARLLLALDEQPPVRGLHAQQGEHADFARARGKHLRRRSRGRTITAIRDVLKIAMPLNTRLRARQSRSSAPRRSDPTAARLR